jgi:hypothetical protein
VWSLLQLHEQFVPGCQEALDSFLREGCGTSRFEHVVTTGEYELYCQAPPSRQTELPRARLRSGGHSAAGR